MIAIHQWTLQKGLLQMAEQEGALTFSLQIPNEKERKIREIVSDIPWHSLTNPAVRRFLAQPRVVCQSDGEYKLYLQLKLLGGMHPGGEPEPEQLAVLQRWNQMGDLALQEHLVKQLEKICYRVSVSTSPHPIYRAQRPMRCITLELKTTDSFKVFIKGLAALIGVSASNFKHVRNLPALQNAILGIGDPEAERELEIAHARGDLLKLSFSWDGKEIYLEYEHSLGQKAYDWCVIS